MYRILILLLFFTSTVFAQETGSYSLAGDVSQILGAKKIYLTMTDKNGKNVRDSAEIVDGKFLYKNRIEEITLATLTLVVDEKLALKPAIGKRNSLRFFLEPVPYSLVAKDWLSDATITGSKLNDEYVDYKEKIYVLYKKMEPFNLNLRKLESANDLVGLAFTEAKLDSLGKVEEEFMAKFIRSHPSSPVSLYALNEYTRSVTKNRPFERYFNLLSPDLKQTVMGKQLAEKLVLQSYLAIGTEAPAFSQPDTLGKLVQLNDFKGKYVFVDFWASWCGPCRKEIPFLKKTYERFKHKNFQILAVSLDSSREKWLAAIKEDGTSSWPQVGDMKGGANTVSRRYKIKAIPQNLLLDPSGKIIAKNLYGLDLEKVLEKTLP